MRLAGLAVAGPCCPVPGGLDCDGAYAGKAVLAVACGFGRGRAVWAGSALDAAGRD